MSTIIDGTSNTIIAIEAGPIRSWAEPILWTTGMQVSQSGRSGTNAALADGSIRRLPLQISTETLRALETRGGGEVIKIDQ